VALPILTWLVYMVSMTAFVGVVSGVVLAGFWAIKCSLGLDEGDQRPSIRRAVIGFSLIVLGIIAGAVVVIAAGVGPFLAIVFAVRALFGDYPPALAATVTLAAVIALALLIATWFARWWQRLFWVRLREVAA
jgi:hypothetical protein